ncbi:MAG: DNA polymerase I [Candidatus Omnitrophica bacterium]|nr:DNA polymerase I [Candidatus Omnitrophota bacterium]
MKEKVYLLDGNAFCYRAYYAIQHLSNSKGEATNAVYGFMMMLRRIIQEQQPTHVAVCFDLAGPTFRDELYEKYKATRKPMPGDLVEQIPVIKEMISAYRIPIYEQEGFEADDVLGTLARRLAKGDREIYIATGDKDILQLVNSNIKVFSIHKEGLIYDAEKVRERFEGLGPDKIVDVMALMGDSSDNIPGVPGVGPKTAVNLIKEFGSLDNLLKNAEKIKSKSVKEKIVENKDMALQSRKLAEIHCEVPIKAELSDLALAEPDGKKLLELFKRLEFRSLIKEFSEETSEERSYRIIKTEKEFHDFLGKLSKLKAFAVDTETTSEDPLLAKLVGISFSWKAHEAYYIPVSGDHAGVGLPTGKVLRELKPILEDSAVEKYGQNIKYDLNVLHRHGVRLAGAAFDTMIASYLLNASKLNHNLDDLSLEHLGVKKITTESLIGSGKKAITMDQVPVEKVGEYSCEDSDCVWRLVDVFKPRLTEDGLRNLFERVEMPLLEVLAAMERTGVKIDVKILGELSKQCDKELAALARDIYGEAGEEFNINSTKQLAGILFEKMNLPKIKRTKTGFSTDTSVLEKLSETHSLPRLLLEYREKSKLKSTYMDALPELVNPETGLVHTSFNQTTTSTGRLSSTDPNVQNIPIRSELGRQIRKAFIPRAKGRKILSADYSQIELRILAHFTEDKTLMKAYQEGLDIHVLTACTLYGVKEKEVTSEMRQAAKTVNFSLIYGKTAFGLSKDLQISVGDADNFIKSYFKQFPRVLEFMESQKERARREGFLTTILGRRAYFPEINSSNANIRNFSERAAINAPIQGSAADLIKRAMIDIYHDLLKEKYETLLMLQVHDELVFDVPDRELKDVSELVRRKMENALKFNVPLKVDIHVGESWYKG